MVSVTSGEGGNHPATNAAIPSDLRAATIEGVRAYEFATALQLELARTAEAEHAKATADVQNLASARAIPLAAEKQRAASLQAAVDSVQSTARGLLEASGFAYVIGAPLGVDDHGRPSVADSAAIAAAYADAHLSLVSLRGSLLVLGRELIASSSWVRARQVLRALCHQEGEMALEAQQALRESYRRPAHLAQAAGAAQEALAIIAEWLVQHPDDIEVWGEALELIGAAVDSNEFELALGSLQVLGTPSHTEVRHRYQDLEREAKLGLGQCMLDTGDVDGALSFLEPLLVADEAGEEVRTLLLAPGMQAHAEGRLEVAWELLVPLLQADHTTKDRAVTVLETIAQTQIDMASTLEEAQEVHHRLVELLPGDEDKSRLAQPALNALNKMRCPHRSEFEDWLREHALAFSSPYTAPILMKALARRIESYVLSETPAPLDVKTLKSYRYKKWHQVAIIRNRDELYKILDILIVNCKSPSLEDDLRKRIHRWHRRFDWLPP